jgi:hypothetical protein
MVPEKASAMRGELCRYLCDESLYLSSGRKIVQILRKNPKKTPAKYTDDDVKHMRKVAAYNKRHLAQEERAKRDPDSNSYKSLKNWGHDALKT